ncbi:MAG: hypothetical protein JWL62_2670 [Hyphomicrobiales bacterium]|nr:hypothetical protein [Hyphomicrobiales bacterium]
MSSEKDAIRANPHPVAVTATQSLDIAVAANCVTGQTFDNGFTMESGKAPRSLAARAVKTMDFMRDISHVFGWMLSDNIATA